MGKQSAGLLLYRHGRRGVEVLLVHPGGPFYRKKDLGVWSIPKGEYESHEDAVAAALREFAEETGATPGVTVPELLSLGSVTQRSGKVVSVWAAPGEFDPSQLDSNTFSIEWPPKSGKAGTFPEVDRVAWFDFETAKKKLLPSQAEFVDRLAAACAERSPRPPETHPGST